MVRFCLLLFLLLYSLPQALGDDSRELLCRANLDYGQIIDTAPIILVKKGKAGLSSSEKSFLVSEISIQVAKIVILLGVDFSLNEEYFAIQLLSQAEVDELSGTVGTNAVTIDGVMNFVSENIKSDIIRHEVLHAMVFKLVENKLPWWIEEGLAQILSGELDSGKIQDARTKTEMKYDQARLRVSGLVKKCGFKAFGFYFGLIEQGNTERYAYNKIFNEGCAHE